MKVKPLDKEVAIGITPILSENSGGIATRIYLINLGRNYGSYWGINAIYFYCAIKGMGNWGLGIGGRS